MHNNTLIEQSVLDALEALELVKSTASFPVLLVVFMRRPKKCILFIPAIFSEFNVGKN